MAAQIRPCKTNRRTYALIVMPRSLAAFLITRFSLGIRRICSGTVLPCSFVLTMRLYPQPHGNVNLC